MKIKFDENGYVIGYATLGGMEGAVEWTGPVPAGFEEDCSKFHLVDGALVPDEARIAAQEAKEAELLEIAEIEGWFNWYDNQCAQYQRCVRLGEEFDRDISELDALAKQKQNRIRELKGE